MGAKLLHISTDYVFDGTGSRPYEADDAVAPMGVYGRTKAEGETAVRSACPEHVIIRTAWLYGKHGANFVYTMLKLMSTKDKIGVVYDQRGTPTWASDLASSIVSVVTAPVTRYGTYQFTDSGETNWHEFAVEIQKRGLASGLLARACAIDALTTEQYGAKVKRPAYSVLSKEKIKRDYGIAIPDWKESLGRFVADVARDREDAEVLRFLPKQSN
jgi:dTDP-4-dehydrorhamnose reductase